MDRIERYFLDRICELKTLAGRGDPWVFQCATSFIEYLAKMHLGKNTNQTTYKAFLRDIFFKACPQYAAFRYACGKADLDVQIYHVLRCGTVHSFSLIADPIAVAQDGRDRSILLAHRMNGATHLTPVVNNRRSPKIDAAVFTAEDFVDDIEIVTKHLFRLSRKRSADGRTLRSNIRVWIKAHPPIGPIMTI
jgi:hypothetical protein